MSDEFVFVRDFIVMHYHLTERDDTPFWRHCQSMPIPDGLRHRLDLFKQTGRVFQEAGDVFAENNWVQVMLGQGLVPEQYHPIVDSMSDAGAQSVAQGADSRQGRSGWSTSCPAIRASIAKYCPAESGIGHPSRIYLALRFGLKHWLS